MVTYTTERETHMAVNLDGKRVAILIADGFEQVELFRPREALDEVGANTDVASPAEKKVRAWDFGDWGKKIDVDVNLVDARAGLYAGSRLCVAYEVKPGLGAYPLQQAADAHRRLQRGHVLGKVGLRASSGN